MKKYQILLFLALSLSIVACATQKAARIEYVPCDIPESLLSDCAVSPYVINTNGDLLNAYTASLEDLERCSIDKRLIRFHISNLEPGK